MIKYGATRIVFIFPKFVIKIPNIRHYKLFLKGILANLQEKLFSGYYEDLARVIFCDFLGLILIMERAEEVNDISEDTLNSIICSKYVEDAEKYFMLSDCKTGNWGYINNKLVKIDYGE